MNSILGPGAALLYFIPHRPTPICFQRFVLFTAVISVLNKQVSIVDDLLARLIAGGS